MIKKHNKIIVFSDSHGDVESMSKIVCKESPNMIIHLGDYLRDAQKLNNLFPDIRITYIRGNTDFKEDYISENHLLIEGKLFFITHGHKYNVKITKKDIKKGENDNADIILFGHTHESYLKCFDKMWIMNPGSAGKKYIRKTSYTYGIINLHSTNIMCKIKNI